MDNLQIMEIIEINHMKDHIENVNKANLDHRVGKTLDQIPKKCGDVILGEKEVYIFCIWCSRILEYGKFLNHLSSLHDIVFEENILNSTISKANDNEFEKNHMKETLNIILCNNETNEHNHIEIKNVKSINGFPQQFQCQICETIFIKEEYLKEHEKIHHNPQEESLEATNDNPYDSTNSNGNEENKINSKLIIKKRKSIKTNKLECEFCERKFKNNSTKLAHERIHKGQKPYQCSICNKSFKARASFKVHKMVHLNSLNANKNNETFKCDLCDKMFPYKSYLVSHLQRKHLGEKTVPCRYCDKKFLQNSERIQHERSHTGEKPFLCTICGKCFLTNGKLTEHSRRHNGIKPFKCNVCNKGFCSKLDLIDHEKVHTRERPFKCKICNATFPRRNSLRRHAKLHLDVGTYVCPICNKTFKQDCGLYRHMKSQKHN